MSYAKYFFLVFLPLLFSFSPRALHAQTCTLSGYVRSADDGAALAGAVVTVVEAKQNVLSNAQGFYTVQLPARAYTLRVSYLGFAPFEASLKLQKNVSKNFALQQQETALDDVVVSAEKRANVTKAEMSVEKIEIKTIKKIPALMGEVDVVKAIMLLPGVQPAAEGTSAFSVRGGSPDQNLILFDLSTIYNASHLMGFFSVFNNDVIEDVTLYKGDIPAAFGGRLSSLLDVHTKDGDMHGYHANGGVGIISSRLEVDGPIVPGKLSFVAAGRRTYADLFLPLAPEEQIRDAVLHFYDLNGKLVWKVGEHDRLTLAGYYGSDDFGMPVAGMYFSNTSYSLAWNHLYSDKFFSNISVIGSRYDYQLGMEMSGYDAQWNSDISDLGLRADFTLLYGDESSFRFGASSTWHNVNPCDASLNSPTGYGEIVLPKSYSIESAVFAMNQHKLGERLTVKYGLRATLFNNVGAATVWKYNDSYQLVDSAKYAQGVFFNHYYGLEPRVGAVFMLNDNSSLKAAYSRTMQYMHLISNSSAGSPLDVWMPSSPNIRPQVAHQISAGYFRNFLDDAIETSAEVFYKRLSNVVDYRDHAQIMMNVQLEGELRRGIGQTYGLELMVRKSTGKLTGWVSYTYSRSFRQVNTVNNNEWYQASYDRPHNLNIVASYDLFKRVSLSANWTYSTGMPTTFPEGRMVIDGVSIPVYGKRNTYRFEDYHRLDVALNIVLNRHGFYSHELNISAYNAYARHNTWYIQFTEEPEGSGIMNADKLYLFSIVPSVTYNFKF
jgi:hypothetical protein